MQRRACSACAPVGPVDGRGGSPLEGCRTRPATRWYLVAAFAAKSVETHAPPQGSMRLPLGSQLVTLTSTGTLPRAAGTPQTPKLGTTPTVSTLTVTSGTTASHMVRVLDRTSKQSLAKYYCMPRHVASAAPHPAAAMSALPAHCPLGVHVPQTLPHITPFLLTPLRT